MIGRGVRVTDEGGLLEANAPPLVLFLQGVHRSPLIACGCTPVSNSGSCNNSVLPQNPPGT